MIDQEMQLKELRQQVAHFRKLYEGEKQDKINIEKAYKRQILQQLEENEINNEFGVGSDSIVGNRALYSLSTVPNEVQSMQNNIKNGIQRYIGSQNDISEYQQRMGEVTESGYSASDINLESMGDFQQATFSIDQNQSLKQDPFLQNSRNGNAIQSNQLS